MSPVRTSVSEIILAARYLLAQPDANWAETCRALLKRVRYAQDYVQITGRAHAFYGDGSIESYVLRLPLAPMPVRLNPQAFKALTLVIELFSEHAKICE